MKVEYLFVACLLWVTLGILVARQLAERRRRKQVAARLSALIDAPSNLEIPPSLLRTQTQFTAFGKWFSLERPIRTLALFLAQGGWGRKTSTFVSLELLLIAAPLSIAYVIGVEPVIGLALSAVAGAAPFVFLLWQKVRLRRKFIEQLPNAIDLMVAVLRSGHSLPMAVRSVGQEIPAPVGKEFQEVLARINLGQPMAEALAHSTEKFCSYELDLIRRAVAIQAEVGGSLAELLEKTNVTLRQRLKLARHVQVLTAQSRLTAIIVGLMPFAVAFGLNFLNPGYLNPLVQSELGRVLLIVALILQALGVGIMTKLSTVKV
ncbi:MAG TPA: type II secretion system F family protein [Candidatus Obscuribacterales bacterium]